MTRYSERTAGDKWNFDMAARFDLTDGYVGITQPNHRGTDRVLLSPRQFAALIAFASPPAKRRSASKPNKRRGVKSRARSATP